MGVTLGLGIGADTARFRIGHMGHLNPPMLLGTLGTIEAALHSLGVPTGGSGVAAAARVIGDAVVPS
jgi:alanine-glyoxylate transaminase/serine-glyoxylate transaminase/serine-pyruvate transaminase